MFLISHINLDNNSSHEFDQWIFKKLAGDCKLHDIFEIYYIFKINAFHLQKQMQINTEPEKNGCEKLRILIRSDLLQLIFIKIAIIIFSSLFANSFFSCKMFNILWFVFSIFALKSRAVRKHTDSHTYNYIVFETPFLLKLFLKRTHGLKCGYPLFSFSLYKFRIWFFFNSSSSLINEFTMYGLSHVNFTISCLYLMKTSPCMQFYLKSKQTQ